MGDSDLDRAKEEAKGRLGEYLAELGVDTAKAATSGAVCPLCGSGTGKNKTGAFHIDPKTGYKTWHCFACGKGGDIFALYAEINGLAMGEAMEKVYQKLAISRFQKGYQKGREMYTHTHTHTHTDTHTPAPPKRAEPTHAQIAEAEAYILKAQTALTDGSEGAKYLEKRGISLATARAHGLGYDAEARRIVIPRERGYTRRAIDEGAKPRYMLASGLSAELFNKDALALAGAGGFDTAPVYVVEGELDALSIEEAGGCSVALGSTSNARLLIDFAVALNEKLNGGGSDDLWRPSIILALDADEAGEKAATVLGEGLAKLGLEYFLEAPTELYGGQKDANAALMADRKGFTERLALTAEAYAKRKAELAGRMEKAYRAAKSSAAYMEEFSADIHRRREAVPSGFPRLDDLLSGDGTAGDRGGLMEGLYIVGAPSSCGKTTFLLQMADSIAESGRDALIFSLEMSRYELMAKSVSRLTYRLVKADAKKYRDAAAVMGWAEDITLFAKTNYGISKGARYERYSEPEKALIAEATKLYAESIAPHSFIYEGAIGGTGVKEIRDRIAEHIAHTGKPPVVIVDYLQMIAAPDELKRGTDKQILDYNIRELKVASRTYGIPLICVSSYNRESYTAESSLSSLKGSGDIEYSADIVIALTYADMTKAESGDKDKAKAKADLKAIGSKPERYITLELLKNRNGRKGEIPYRFSAKFNSFRELAEGERMEPL